MPFSAAEAEDDWVTTALPSASTGTMSIVCDVDGSWTVSMQVCDARDHARSFRSRETANTISGRLSGLEVSETTCSGEDAEEKDWRARAGDCCAAAAASDCRAGEEVGVFKSRRRPGKKERTEEMMDCCLTSSVSRIRPAMQCKAGSSETPCQLGFVGRALAGVQQSMARPAHLL